MGTPTEPRGQAYLVLSYYTRGWNPDMSWVACLTLGYWSQSPALKPLCPVATTPYFGWKKDFSSISSISFLLIEGR